jgi:hypothetical protein
LTSSRFASIRYSIRLYSGNRNAKLAGRIDRGKGVAKGWQRVFIPTVTLVFALSLSDEALPFREDSAIRGSK